MISNRYTQLDINSANNLSNTEYPNWTTKYTTGLGLCYSYLVPDYLKVLEVRDISFHVKKNLDIYLHHPGQFLSWQVYSFPMRSHQSVYVETSHEVTKIRNKTYSLLK